MTRAAPARARTATLVTVGPAARLAEAADVLASLDQAGSLRHVLLSTSPGSLPSFGALPDVTALESMPPQYLNNAIAALRLSSLPTVIWWRGGEVGNFDGAASLADRMILDVEDPQPLWRRVPALAAHTAITDIRWGRLTRWRAVMARMFDLRQVRRAAGGFDRLVLSGRDRAQCSLFAGWMDASLGWGGRVRVEITGEAGRAPLSKVELRGPALAVRLELLANGVCLATDAREGDTVLASRVIAVGEPGLAAVLSEELRIRSRDLAFENALRTLVPHA